MAERQAAVPPQAEAAPAPPRRWLLPRCSPAGDTAAPAQPRAAAAADLRLEPRAEGGTWAQALPARRLVGKASAPARGAHPSAAAAAPACPACYRSGSGLLCSRTGDVSAQQQNSTCAGALGMCRASWATHELLVLDQGHARLYDAAWPGPKPAYVPDGAGR